MELKDTGFEIKLNRNANLSIVTPKIIGCFSVDKIKIYKPSGESFRHFRMPRDFPLDLKKGTTLTKQKDASEKGNLESLLKYIARTSMIKDGSITDYNFICTHKPLSLIMTSNSEDWCIHATKFDGKIYICGKETKERLLSWVVESDESYDLKFKQYCLAGKAWEDPDISVVGDGVRCVYDMNLGGLKLLYVAEVDGVADNVSTFLHDDVDVLKKSKRVELKTLSYPVQPLDFSQRTSKYWWCQSFLAGIQDIMVGYHTDSGLVNEIKRIQVEALPTIGKDNWCPSECVDFLKRFLQMVQEKMKDVNCLHTVYEFYFDSIQKMISYRVFEGETFNSFLSEDS